jgi:hypothetical protein
VNAVTVATRSPLPLYQRALGPEFHRLAPALALLHGGAAPRMNGTMRVRRGSGLLARLLTTLMRMPESANEAPSTVAVAVAGRVETWSRVIGSTAMITRQYDGRPREVRETFGPVSMRLGLTVRRGTLRVRTRGAAVLGIPLPSWAGVQVVASERAVAPDAFRFDVRVRSPLFGCLIQYSGVLRFAEADARVGRAA